MKCKICGCEYSDKVYRIHIVRCDQKEQIESIETDLTKPLIMSELRRKDIPFNPRDKKEVLLTILNEYQGAE